MPPHCDTMDGPVVTAARQALEQQAVHLMLPWAPKHAESEIISAFEKTIAASRQGKEAKEVAERWFFETIVRLHRAGEGAPFTGLKPAGLDEGPVVPKVEHAIETGNPDEVINFLQNTIKEEVEKKFEHVMHAKHFNETDVDAARIYVSAMLGLTLYCHHGYTFLKESAAHHGAQPQEHSH